MYVSFCLAIVCFILTFIGKEINVNKEWVETLIGIIAGLFMMFSIAFLYVAAGFSLGYL